MLTTVTVVLLFMPAVITQWNGTSLTACIDMTPGYKFSEQNTTAPYNVTFNSSTYSPDQAINVTLAGISQIFRGFLIEPRAANASNVSTTYGTITDITSETQNPCEGNVTGLTHTNNSDKSSVSFTWKAPSTNVGDIVFLYTVVQNESVYWVQQRSSPLTFLNPTTTISNATATTSNTTTTISSNTTTTPSSAASTAMSSTTQTIGQAGQCGVSVNCYPVGVDCSTSCDFSVMWLAAKNSDSVMFTLKKKISLPDYYIAIGFSEDMDSMGDDSVVACISTAGSVKVQASYNTVGDNDTMGNTVLDNPNFGLNLTNSSYSDGMLSCTFERKVSAPEAGNVSYSSQFYNLAKQYYLLVAHGGPKRGELRQHISKKSSVYKINFLAKPSIVTGECGVDVNCYPVGVDCSTNCNFSVMWLAAKNSDSVMFTLKKNTSLSDYYIAIGFSEDMDNMGNDSMVACISTNGSVKVQASYNTVGDNDTMNNTVLDNPNFGIRLTDSSFNDGILSCTFERKVSAPLAGNVSYSSQFFDLAKQYYLRVAYGGELQQHIAEDSSLYLINFLAQPPKPTPTSTGILVKNTECGKSLGCFHECASDGTCSFVLTWADNGGDSIDMTLACKRSLNEYCAIGLSSDDQMGDDSVIQCIPSGSTNVYLSYNSGETNQILADPQIGLSNVAITYADGILRCTFSRKKTAALANASAGRKKRATTVDATTYKDMNSDWTLMLAYGVSSSESNINKHSETPVVSSQKADFQSFTDIGAKEVVDKVVKAHGILMVIAWLLFATFGIFMARFYKTVWPDGMEWLGNKRWFVVHRVCMVLAFLLTAASFIMIFIDVNGYADITGSNFKMSHPIIGIIIMGLAVINPVMSLFRCAPTASNRPIFNWAHRFVGVSAHVLSVINIFSGVSLAEAQTSNDVMIPLWIYVGWVGLLEILFLFYDCVFTKVKRQEMYELKNMSVGDEKPRARVHTPKVILLIFHLMALLALTIAVCVLIGQTSS